MTRSIDLADVLERGRALAAEPDVAAAREAHLAAVARSQAEERRHAARRALEAMHVPLDPELLDRIARGRLEAPGVAAVRSWLLGPGPELVVLGPPHDRMVLAAVVIAARRGGAVLVREKELVTAHAGGRLGPAWRAAVVAPTAVLDGIGAAGIGDRVRVPLGAVLAARSGRERRTVILAGSRAELDSCLGLEARARLVASATVIDAAEGLR